MEVVEKSQASPCRETILSRFAMIELEVINQYNLKVSTKILTSEGKMTESVEMIASKPMPSASTSKKQGALRVVGFIMLLPALLLLLLIRLVPFIQMAVMSFQKVNILGTNHFIGFDNYTRLFSEPLFGGALGLTLLLTLLRTVVVILPPLGLALGMAALKPWLEKMLRVIISLPWLMFSPVFLGVVWFILLNPVNGLGNNFLTLNSLEGLRGTIILMDLLAFFGLASGVAATIYLAVLRGAAQKPFWKPLLITVGLLVLAVIAISLQSGEAVFQLIQNQMTPQTTTLMLNQVRLTSQMVALGLAAANGMVALLPIALLGVLFTVALVLLNFRLKSSPTAPAAPAFSLVFKIIAIIFMAGSALALLLSLLPHLLVLIPMLQSAPDGVIPGFGAAFKQFNLGTVLLNTWLMPVLTVLLVQLPVSYLAALGIGAMRPLGRHSEWLLLFFAPFLFIKIGMLSPAFLRLGLELRLLQTVLGMGMPYLVNLPLLFILVFFFKGQNDLYIQGKAGFWKAFIVPSLPLALAGAIFGVLAMQQDVIWMMMASIKPETWMLPIALFRMGMLSMGSMKALSSVTLVIRLAGVIPGLLLVAVYQIFYLPRVTAHLADAQKPLKPAASGGV